MLPTVKFEFVPDKFKGGGLRVVLTTIVPTGRAGIAGSYTLFPVMDKHPEYLNIYDEDGLYWDTTYGDREISEDTVLYGTTILNCGNWTYNTGIYADYSIFQSDIILNKLLEWNKDVCDFLDKNDSKN